MLAVIFRLALSLVLVASAIFKASSPDATQAAFGTFGIERDRTRRALWGALIVTELALAAGVAAGLDVADYLAAGLMAAFGVALSVVYARGLGGAPCACFGARSKVTRFAVARAWVLAAAFAAASSLPSHHLTTDQWLALGFGLTTLACVGLAVALIALAREVGMLRLHIGPDAALEVPEEGPEIGSISPLIERFVPGVDADLALGVFVSSGCRACQALEPAIESLRHEPILAVETFEEVADAEAWLEAEAPGSPFAVAMDRGGVVLAKGTFNNLAQLESVLGTAERRRAAVAVIGAAGG